MCLRDGCGRGSRGRTCTCAHTVCVGCVRGWFVDGLIVIVEVVVVVVVGVVVCFGV